MLQFSYETFSLGGVGVLCKEYKAPFVTLATTPPSLFLMHQPRSIVALAFSISKIG